MTFDPKDFFELAKQLFDDLKYNEDARYRTSISRAYYAAHLVCKKKLEDIGVSFPIEKDERMGRIHELVIYTLKRKNRHIGEMLSNLRQKRNWADYNTNRQFKKYGVQILLFNAETIINDVEKLK